MQIACVRALLETAQCAARGDVSLDDVYCLLAGLQSPKEVRLRERGTSVLRPVRSSADTEPNIKRLVTRSYLIVQAVRDAALRGLLCIAECLPRHLEDPDNALDLTKRLLLATFDVSEDNKYVSNRRAPAGGKSELISSVRAGGWPPSCGTVCRWRRRGAARASCWPWFAPR